MGYCGFVAVLETLPVKILNTEVGGRVVLAWVRGERRPRQEVNSLAGGGAGGSSPHTWQERFRDLKAMSSQLQQERYWREQEIRDMEKTIMERCGQLLELLGVHKDTAPSSPSRGR